VRHVLLVAAWFIILTGIVSYLFPNQMQRWSSNLAHIVGAGPEPITLAIGETTGYTRTLAESLAGHLEQTGHQVTLIEAENETAAGTLLLEGNTSLAFLSGTSVPESGVLQLAQFERAYVHVVIPMDMAAESLADVIELNIGVAGMFSDGDAIFAAMTRELGFGGSTPNTNIRKLHPGEMASALRQGQVDVVVAILPLMSPEINLLLGTGYYRLLPVPEATAFSYRIPGVEKDIIPDSLYGPGRQIPPKSTTPFTTAVVPLYLMTHPGTDNATLMPLLNAFMKPDWQASHGSVGFARMSNNGIPIHPLVQSGEFSAGIPTQQWSAPWLILMLVALLIIVWQYYAEYQTKQRKALATQVRAIIESGDINLGEEGPGLLVELARQMMDGQNRAMQHWLSGRYGTQQMQLLMSLYLGRSLQLIARYNMMPKDVSGNVHPQRRPWQAPEKSGDIVSLQLLDAKRDDVPVIDTPRVSNKASSGRQTVQNTSHADQHIKVQADDDSSEKPIAKNKAVSQPPLNPSLNPSKKVPSISNQNKSEIRGEDITHEVLPSDYSGDIIAVRKRPRPNTIQEQQLPEETQKTAPQQATSDKKPDQIRNVETAQTVTTAQTSTKKMPVENKVIAVPTDTTVNPENIDQKQTTAREQVAPKNASLPQNNPARKRRKKRRFNKEEVKNNVEGQQQRPPEENIPNPAKPNQEKNNHSVTNSDMKEPDKKSTDSTNDQMMLF